MDLLLIGGGVFLGRAVLDAALARGHRVTVFNRGRARATWPAGVEVVTGDRVADLGRLAGRRWDAVIDTCGYVPVDVQASATALREACGAYLFVSSISAYAEGPAASSDSAAAPADGAASPEAAALPDETQPLAAFDAIAPDDRDLRHYGTQKAACEARVVAAFGPRALIVRPGLIVGAGDRSGRFSHWVWRSAAGGAMLVPDVPPTQPLQFIDVRDLGAWMVQLLEAGARGAVDASGPLGGTAVDWPALIATCRSAAAAHGHAPADAVPVDEAFLLRHGAQPWSELPLWLPSFDPAYAGVMRALKRAAAAGLRTRPLRETVDAVLAEGIPPADDRRRAGKLTPAREAELLAAWAAEPHRGATR